MLRECDVKQDVMTLPAKCYKYFYELSRTNHIVFSSYYGRRLVSSLCHASSNKHLAVLLNLNSSGVVWTFVVNNR